MKTNARLLAISLALSAIFWGCEDRVSGPQAPGQGPVFAKGGSAGPDQRTYTMTFYFPGEESGPIFGDGRVLDASAAFTTYTDGECGVGAVYWGLNPVLNTADSRIKASESADCGGTQARVVKVHFPEESYDADNQLQVDGLEWNGQTADAKWFNLRNRDWTPDEVKDLAKGDIRPKALWITFADNNSHPGGNGWGDACPGLLRFDTDYGASPVQVERVQQQSEGDTVDEWEIRAEFPDDLAACVAGTSEFYVLGYYHLPFQVNVMCTGDC